MQNWLWCSTRSQMNCTRNNSPVLYFFYVCNDWLHLHLQLWIPWSFHEFPRRFSSLAYAGPCSTHSLFYDSFYQPAHPGFALCGNTNVSSQFEIDSWTFFSPCCFPPVKSLEASISCARLVAVGPQEDCVISCCRLTSSVYNTCSPTTLFWWLSPVCWCWLFYHLTQGWRALPQIFFTRGNYELPLQVFFFFFSFPVSIFWIQILCLEMWMSSLIFLVLTR